MERIGAKTLGNAGTTLKSKIALGVGLAAPAAVGMATSPAAADPGATTASSLETTASEFEPTGSQNNRPSANEQELHSRFELPSGDRTFTNFGYDTLVGDNPSAPETGFTLSNTTASQFEPADSRNGRPSNNKDAKLALHSQYELPSGDRTFTSFGYDTLISDNSSAAKTDYSSLDTTNSPYRSDAPSRYELSSGNRTFTNFGDDTVVGEGFGALEVSDGSTRTTHSFGVAQISGNRTGLRVESSGAPTETASDISAEEAWQTTGYAFATKLDPLSFLSREGRGTPRESAGQPTETRPLRIDSLAEIQRTLQKLGYDVGPIDGIDGPLTQKSVRQFQQTNSLQPTGEIDTATQTQLAKIALTSNQPTNPATDKQPEDSQLDMSDAVVTQALNAGNTDSIAQVQERLNKLSYWAGAPDGVIGDITRNALVAFQKAEGLRPTGEPDAATLLRLAEAALPTSAAGAEGNQVTVDLARQIIHLHDDDGQIVQTYNTSSGKAGHETSSGVWKVEWEIDGIRNAPLGKLYRPKYFHERGLAIHGSSDVANEPRSAGCLRVTNEAMDKIWESGLVEKGTRIVVV